METSKTAPLSTSRLKWALEIVTASKNCHEEEPADKNENKSQPIIAKRLESSFVLGFLIFVGSVISFSNAVSSAESQKAKTFRIARFLSQKLSG